MKSRILLKVLTIVLMISAVFTIIVTVVLNAIGLYPFDLMAYHMSAGILFLSVLPIHIYMMRQKLKKLSEQIISLASTGEVGSSCASQLLPNALHSKSLGEFCHFLGLDCSAVRDKLSLEGIMVISTEVSIETIASTNHTDVMRIFSIMLQKTTPEQEFYSRKLVFAA